MRLVLIEARLRRADGKLNGADANGSSAISSCECCDGVAGAPDGGDNWSGSGGGAIVGAGELNTDDGEDNVAGVAGVVGVAGIDGMSDSFKTIATGGNN